MSFKGIFFHRCHLFPKVIPDHVSPGNMQAMKISSYVKQDSSPVNLYRLLPTNKHSITAIQTFQVVKFQFNDKYLQ